MIFYDYLLTPQLFSYTAISRRNTVSCIKYQYRAALISTVFCFLTITVNNFTERKLNLTFLDRFFDAQLRNTRTTVHQGFTYPSKRSHERLKF